MAEQAIRFEITGLNCGSCAGRAERALHAVPGVAEANVNLATKTATVTGSADRITLQEALKAAGYPAVETRVSLVIQGMSCASCAGRVERALHAMDGVLEAHVNLAKETAEVQVVKGAVAPERLAQAVTDAGYPAKPAGNDSA